jgi:hypothetical protein
MNDFGAKPTLERPPQRRLRVARLPPTNGAPGNFHSRVEVPVASEVAHFLPTRRAPGPRQDDDR